MKNVFRKLLLSTAIAALFQSSDAATSVVGAKLWNEKLGGTTNVDVAALNKTFIDLASTLSPAVVNIYTTTRMAPRFHGGQEDFFRFFFGNPFNGDGGGMYERPREAQSLGSGFVINEEGMIVTNGHVVQMNGHNADSVMVKFMTDPEGSKGHEAKILGVDPTTDVAVLRLKDKTQNLSVAPFGDSDKVKVGEWVIAIGNPYGHTNSVTKGIVSALGRDIDEANTRTDFIQTDASINPGNSGGPLFNLYGEVIGINSMIDARAQGIGFAIPINNVKTVVRQLVEKGEVSLGWIGITMAEINPQIARSVGLKDDAQGVLIQDVFPGEPAAKAGLRPYDFVTAINGKTIRSSHDFAKTVANLQVGAKVQVDFVRDSKTRSATLTVSRRKSEQELARLRRSAPMDEPGMGQGSPGDRAGLLLSELTPGLRARLRIPRDVRGGVVVQQVIPGTQASEAGVEPGDVITEINRRPVRNMNEAETAMKARGNNFLLKIQRGSASVIILLDMQTGEPSQ